MRVGGLILMNVMMPENRNSEASLEDLLDPEDERSVYNQLRDAFKRGLLDKTTLGAAELLLNTFRRNKAEIERRREYEYLHSLCFIAEIFERVGDTGKALEALGIETPTILSFPHFEPLPTDADLSLRRVMREKIRLVLDWAISRYYRRHEYLTALGIADRCERLVKDRIYLRDQMPCLGTLAQIYRLKGNIYRQLQLYPEAEKWFGKAIINYYVRAQSRIKEGNRDITRLSEAHPQTPEVARKITRLNTELQNDLSLVTRRVAMILTQGFGRIAYRQGLLSRAEYTYLLPARLLLLLSESEIVKAYNRLVISAVLRSVADPDGKRVIKALSEAQEAERTFEEFNYRRYVLRARFEQALCYLRMKNRHQARELADAVREQAERSPYHRLAHDAILLQSRIAEENGSPGAAVELAEEAFRRAELHGLSKIEAHIRLAESKFALGEYEEARAELEVARRINRRRPLPGPVAQSSPASTNRPARGDDNTELRPNDDFDVWRPDDISDSPVQDGADIILDAQITFLLARIYLAEGQIHRAEPEWNKGDRLASRIEHAFIREMRDKIKYEMDAYRESLVIRIGDDESLDYDDYRPLLLDFLIKQATSRSKNKTSTEIAKLLGVSRQTLIQWRSEIERQKKKGADK
jgi:tetratricopeptide (TPR) repeat protein